MGRRVFPEWEIQVMKKFFRSLGTESGLTWDTILRYAKSDRLERDKKNNDRPIYFHATDCPSFCNYACNGAKGEKIAADVETAENWEPEHGLECRDSKCEGECVRRKP
jgi:hypothetical protein